MPSEAERMRRRGSSNATEPQPTPEQPSSSSQVLARALQPTVGVGGRIGAHGSSVGIDDIGKVIRGLGSWMPEQVLGEAAKADPCLHVYADILGKLQSSTAPSCTVS